MDKGLVTARFVISGNVQGVGYRAFVKQSAQNLGIKGFVKNLENGRVEAFCQGNKAVLEKLRKELKIRTTHGWFKINAKVKVFYNGFEKPPQKKFRSQFYIDYTDAEKINPGFEAQSLERSEIIALAGIELRESTGENFNQMAEKYGEISKEMKELGKEVKQSNENNAKLIKTLIGVLKSKK